MDNGIVEELHKLKLQQKIDKLVKKYKNKKIMLYGAGIYFDKITENFDLSGLNIIGVSDKNFNSDTKQHKGFNAFPPEEISEQKPDLVVICASNSDVIEDYFEDILFPQYGEFKYKPILQPSIWELIFG